MGPRSPCDLEIPGVCGHRVHLALVMAVLSLKAHLRGMVSAHGWLALVPQQLFLSHTEVPEKNLGKGRQVDCLV